MNNLEQIQQDIEQARTVLHRMVGAVNGNISHPEVAELSARLDELILSHTRLRADQLKKRRF
jgi:hypothetical protein